MGCYFWVQTLAANRQVESEGPFLSPEAGIQYIGKVDQAKRIDFRLYDFDADKVIAFMYCGRKENVWNFVF